MPDYYTVAQVAQIMRTTEIAVRNWITTGIKSRGWLAATREYKEYRITPEALEAFLGSEVYNRYFSQDTP